MIVTVPCRHIEAHTPEHLLQCSVSQIEARNNHEELSISMRAALLEIQVIHRTKRLDVVFNCLSIYHFAIKPARHEVCPCILFEQATFRHVDTSS
jgi:hypothetical protein